MTKLALKQLDFSPINGLLSNLVEAWKPKAIWLFGSRARGEAHAYSDWDLLVVAPDEVAEKAEEDPLFVWPFLKRSGVNADLIVCSEDDFKEGARVPNTLGYEVFYNGIPIYEQ